ncbi:hypothetical protein AB6D11_06045 [Vibrio splendidus]
MKLDLIPLIEEANMKNVTRLTLLLSLIIGTADANENKWISTIGNIKNYSFVDSLSRSTAEFDQRAGVDFDQVAVYMQTYHNNKGMFDKEGTSSQTRLIQSTIVSFVRLDKIWVFSDGKLAYVAVYDTVAKKDFSNRKLASQSAAAESYQILHMPNP